MATFKSKKKTRGRPPGRSAKGERSRQTLYDTAIRLFSERGYEQTTLRGIAREAGVSSALIYKYFPSKAAFVHQLYDELSGVYVERSTEMPAGKWRDRAVFAMTTSLKTLGPHRSTLKAVVGLLMGDSTMGLFSPGASFSRNRVHGVFLRAVTDASDAPAAEIGQALSNVLYVAHLGVILWWLLDRSEGQRATEGLIGLMTPLLAKGALMLWLPGVGPALRSADGLIRRGLYGEAAEAAV